MADGDDQKQSNHLNFNLQEFLGDNSASDASFQSMVQNMSGQDGLPAELQQLLGGSNGTDLNLLGQGNTSGGTNSQPISPATTPQHAIQQQQQQTPSSSGSGGVPWVMPTSGSAAMPSNVHVMSMSMPSSQQPTPSPITSTAGNSVPVQSQPATNSTTLLENITSQLPPERKDQFFDLFRQLQNNVITPEQFLAQARSLLGQQQYQQLEDLKNKPNQDNKASEKRPISSAQNMTGIITPQMKRPKQEHIPPGMPMGPPISTPMTSSTFKTPAGLQIPRSAAATAVPGGGNMMRTATPTSSTPAPGGSGGGGGGDRIDYDTLTDVMGYAGVDLREEAEHFLKEGDGTGAILPDGVDRSKIQDFMNGDLLRSRVLELAQPLQISNVDQDFISYLALATQERLRGLVEQMVDASKHRVMSQAGSAAPPLDERTGHPLYRIVVQQDPRKQLLAIERAEREEERKRKELLAERERRMQMGEGEGEDGKSKKKKKDKDGTGAGGGPTSGGARGSGPGGASGDGSGKGGSTSETALIRAIGGVRKSWMLTGNKDTSTPGGGTPRSSGGGGGGSAAGATGAEGGPGGPGGSSGGLDDGSPRGRGRPRGRKTGDGLKRGAGRGRGAAGRDLRHDGLGLFLPPSTIGRTHRLGDPSMRKVTVRDAIFALEKDCQTTGRSGSKRTLLKSYNQWLK
ncbi:hypothetical protein RO3G_15633 [Lichtheimia corymbifera JMRC:FSU:9682]|uniref:Transcription initiation factor TFIID subunit 4 n=1 Tax=Lichtheimia corymbifera JMRC:FSU:9682 TaxID=1263082 RepID=A0A068RRL4_9FUNG|nr:hypothetical protein RO3G_15633 [Lichtheimia corymbifera JMRC:FSU:9682]